MNLPESDGHIPFDTGGVCLTKNPTQVWLMFHTKQNRVVIEAPVPFYIFDGINEQESREMVENAWDTACTFVTETMMSRPDEKTVEQIIEEIRDLLGLRPIK